MTQAVVGLLFSPDRSAIVLIQKKRPEFHAGLWNGPGGKVEPGETIRGAVRREFREETGLDIEDWDYFASVDSLHWRVHFLCAFDVRCDLIRTTTDEEVRVVPLAHLDALRLTPNLSWLIPAALSPALIMIHAQDNELERRSLGLPV